jgi:membrane associated rhomboid family serine protease
MLPLEIFLYLLLILVAILQILFTHIPLGNEKSTVRRLPWVTFSIIILNVLIYLGTLPVLSKQEAETIDKRMELLEYLEQNPSLLYDKAVRQKLVDEGIVPQQQWSTFDAQTRDAEGIAKIYEEKIGEYQAARLRAELDVKIAALKQTLESHLYYKFGLAPNGKWSFYQLITCLFMHGGWLHLIGNMLFFFAVGFSLEDLWGRSTFLAFYLLAGIAATVPSLLYPEVVPLIGASGAISGAMGAFLIRLPRAKIKIGWAFMPLSVFGLILTIRKRLFGIINVPTYIYMPYYLVGQLLAWWMMRKTGEVSGVAYTAHIAGFAFGMVFALLMKVTRVEEKIINPRIESKVSFSASPVVAEAFELMDKGNYAMAQGKLQSHLAVLPNDVGALMALIQVYQHAGNFEQVNQLFARVIRQHLTKGDKEAALYAYDSLLSAFPEDQVNPKLPVRDWMMICQYVRELDMPREAAVEYERIAKTCPTDPLAVRACLEGGESALVINDLGLAIRLFEMALTLNPTDVYQSRARMGIDKCIAGGGQHLRRSATQPNGHPEAAPEPKRVHR